MSAPANAAIRWWQGLQPRERWMVGTMLVLVAAFIAWYGVMRPLDRLRDEQRARYDRAAGSHATLLARQRSLERLPAPGDLSTAAREAAVDATRVEPGTAGTIDIEVASSPAPALFAWLDRLQQAYGVTPVELQAQRQPDGVSARLRLPAPAAAAPAAGSDVP